MLIRIEGSNLPGSGCGASPQAPDGYRDIRVGVQRGTKPDELEGVVSGDAPSATWTLECVAVQTPGGVDFKGPHVRGPRGGRFIYLCWVAAGAGGVPTMFRRAKLRLDAIPPQVLEQAAETGALVARLGLTDAMGYPLCASVRPPVIEWSAADRGLTAGV